MMNRTSDFGQKSRQEKTNIDKREQVLSAL